VHPEAIEGLPEQRVLADGRLPAQAFTPVGTSGVASRQGHRIADSEASTLTRCAGDQIQDRLFKPTFLIKELRNGGLNQQITTFPDDYLNYDQALL
jgi:hypothetical protein